MERFITKYDLLNLVYQDDTLRKTTKAVMQYLVALSNQDKCHPAVITIAGALGVSERTVQRHMRHLETAGYLQRKSRFYHQEQLTNEYRFMLDCTTDKSTCRAIGHSIGDTAIQEKIDNQTQPGLRDRKIDQLKYIYETQLKPTQRMLLAYLIHKSNQNRLCYGQIKHICHELHISGRLLHRTLQELRQIGLVRIKSCQGNLIVKVIATQESIDLESSTIDRAGEQVISEELHENEIKRVCDPVKPQQQKGEAKHSIKIQNIIQDIKEVSWWKRKLLQIQKWIREKWSHFLS